MASRSVLAWFHAVVWLCIYGGLIAIVLGVFVARQDIETARTMQALGLGTLVAGVLLIWLRSHIHED